MWGCWKTLLFSVLDRHSLLRPHEEEKDSTEWIGEEIHQLMWACNSFGTKFKKTRNQADSEQSKCVKKHGIQQIHKPRLFELNWEGSEKNPRRAWNQLSAAVYVRSGKASSAS